MNEQTFTLQPGDRVNLIGHHDWGNGFVQSVVGSRVTVNFEHAGKQLIDVRNAVLEPVREN